jgi:5'-3' exonuclease
MGIRGLNRFIQNRCVTGLSRVHLKEFTGKRIAVDTSIYMYRYSGEGALLENMYLMGSVFLHYNINAVFVFDGPPPPQKTELIEIRRKKKEEAKKQYDVLAKIIKEKKKEPDVVTTEIDDISETMRELKKQFVRLRDSDIVNVKELIVSFGFATIDAEGEADTLCANLCLKRRVDACMSDDMDMFVYGCPVVLRNISLLNHSVMTYNTSEILKSLSLTQQEFKMMCVVSGTDYSHTSSHISHSPESVFKQMTKFKMLSTKEQDKYHESGGGFYDWYAEQQPKPKLKPKSKLQQPPSQCSQSKTCENEDTTTESVSAITYLSNEAMFNITSNSHNELHYKQLIVLNRSNIQKQRIIEIMAKEDFIFIDQAPSDETVMKSLSEGKSSLSVSPLYSVCVGGGSGSSVESPEQQAAILAKEVYGVDNISSFQELHTIHKKSKRK